jgi:sugar phosphate isomerase/epimerase
LDLLGKARALGVRVVQFADNLPLTSLSDLELDALAAAAAAQGVAIELGTRGLDRARLEAHLALARRFGAPLVRLVVDSPGDEPTPSEATDRLRPIVAAYAGEGIKLALENHGLFPARTLAHRVEELGRARVGSCLDTVNSFGALEGPEVVVGTLAPYALNLHVKDFIIRRVSSQMGFVVTGCPAGQGRLNVPWLLERLRTAGRDVNAILELGTPFGPTLDATIAQEQAWAEASIRCLRQFIPH